MGKIRGRNTRVEISKTFGEPLEVESVSLAKPAVVVTAAAHTLVAGRIGIFQDVTGMVQIDGQAASVALPSAEGMTLEGLNARRYSDFTGGNFKPVATWALLSDATSYEIPNAESEKLDATTLLDIITQEEAGMLGAQSVSLNGFSNTSSEAIDLINDAAIDGELMVVRITLEDGSRRVFAGTPSLPGESLTVKQLGTNGLSFATKGRVLFLPKVV
jgi:hypothetical protein